MTTSTTVKRSRGMFFSSTKSFSIAFGWDFDEIAKGKETDPRWQFLQLLDAVCSKRVDTTLFRNLIIDHANALGLIVQTHETEIGTTFYQISSNEDVDKIAIVSKAIGFDRSFVETWDSAQIDAAFSNLAKSDAKKGVLWLVANGDHILSRPTIVTETLGDIKTQYRTEYLDN